MPEKIKIKKQKNETKKQNKKTKLFLLSNIISYIEIIGGGGIRNTDDVRLYKRYGVDHISVSTLCFNPILFL